jgi:HSP20 family molecular chaperone IbpA
MSTLFIEKSFSPWDVLFRNLFDSRGDFESVLNSKSPHPLDIYYNDSGLFFEIACTGLDKSDVAINTEGDILKVEYIRKDGDDCCETNKCQWLHRGLTKKSFNLGYRISSKFDLSKADAKMANGLLTIQVPYAEEMKPKPLQIN